MSRNFTAMPERHKLLLQLHRASKLLRHHQATLDISSTPPDADIELDGTFAGNTPSSVGVPPGDHIVKVTKKGYTAWQRKYIHQVVT